VNYDDVDNGLVIPVPFPRVPSNLGSRKNSVCHRVQLSVHQGPVSEVSKYMKHTGPIRCMRIKSLPIRNELCADGKQADLEAKFLVPDREI
jgi:hypothetical protein